MAVPLDPDVAVLRAQHPGAYDDLDDATLAAAVERKEAVAALQVPSAPPTLADVAGAWGEAAAPLTGAVGDWWRGAMAPPPMVDALPDPLAVAHRPSGASPLPVPSPAGPGPHGFAGHTENVLRGMGERAAALGAGGLTMAGELAEVLPPRGPFGVALPVPEPVGRAPFRADARALEAAGEGLGYVPEGLTLEGVVEDPLGLRLNPET